MAAFQTKKPELSLEIPQLRGMNVISVLLLLACLVPGAGVSYMRQDAWGIIVGAILGAILAQAPRIAKQWEARLCSGWGGTPD